MWWHNAISQSDPYKTLHNSYYSDLENKSKKCLGSSSATIAQISLIFTLLCSVIWEFSQPCPHTYCESEVQNISSKSSMLTEGDDDKMQEWFPHTLVINPFTPKLIENTFSQRCKEGIEEKWMSNAVRIGSIIIFHCSKLWKAKFYIMCDVIFLVRVWGKFEIGN